MVENGAIDYEKLSYTINTAVRFLDNIIEISEFPLPQIDEFVRQNRKIGLGFMGFADMLYKLNIPYNSEKALSIAKKVQSFIYQTAESVSIELGKERGIYPNSKGDNKRNAALTTIAPTGSISMICNVSSGCEPNFALSYKRFATSMNKNFYYTNAILEEELKQRSIYSEELIDKISQNGGSLKGISEIPKDMQKIFVIASEISPEWHVKMQAAFQNNGVDSAVSKTINMLNNATVEDVNNAYMLAYKMKCKGITIYRDGSRQNQVLSTNSTSVSENNQTESKYVKPNKRKKRTPGITEDYFVGCGKLYITVNGDKDGLVETFSNLGGNGVCSGYSEGLSRMISLAMRSNIDPYEIVDQLQMVKCPNCKGKKIDAKSCPHAFSKAIETRLKELGINKQEKQIETIVVENVEECKHPKMIMQEGCNVCPDCGYSKCS